MWCALRSGIWALEMYPLIVARFCKHGLSLEEVRKGCDATRIEIDFFLLFLSRWINKIVVLIHYLD